MLPCHASSKEGPNFLPVGPAPGGLVPFSRVMPLAGKGRRGGGALGYLRSKHYCYLSIKKAAKKPGLGP